MTAKNVLAAGMNDYLAKPLEADILDKVLGAHMEAQTENEAGPGYDAHTAKMQVI